MMMMIPFFGMLYEAFFTRKEIEVFKSTFYT